MSKSIISEVSRQVRILDQSEQSGRGFFAFLEKNGTSAEVIYTTLDKELTFNTITYDPNTTISSQIFLDPVSKVLKLSKEDYNRTLSFNYMIYTGGLLNPPVCYFKVSITTPDSYLIPIFTKSHQQTELTGTSYGDFSFLLPAGVNELKLTFSADAGGRTYLYRVYLKGDIL